MGAVQYNMLRIGEEEEEELEDEDRMQKRRWTGAQITPPSLTAS